MDEATATLLLKLRQNEYRQWRMYLDEPLEYVKKWLLEYGAFPLSSFLKHPDGRLYDAYHAPTCACEQTETHTTITLTNLEMICSLPCVCAALTPFPRSAIGVKIVLFPRGQRTHFDFRVRPFAYAYAATLLHRLGPQCAALRDEVAWLMNDTPRPRRGRKLTPKAEQMAVIVRWHNVQATVTQADFCDREAISTATLRRWMSEI